MMENVEEMARAESDSSRVDFLHGAFKAMNYGVASALLDAARYNLPRRRLRACAVALDYAALGITQQQAEDLAENCSLPRRPSSGAS